MLTLMYSDMINNVDINADNMLQIIKKYSIQTLNIFEYDFTCAGFMTVAKYLKHCWRIDDCIKFIDAMKELCSEEYFEKNFHGIEYGIKNMDNKNERIVNLEMYHIDKVNYPQIDIILEYIMHLLNNELYDKYVLIYDKYIDYIVNTCDDVRIFIFYNYKLSYLQKTGQIIKIYNTECNINDKIRSYCASQLASYYGLKSNVVYLMDLFKQHNFEVIEDYTMNTDSGCFDSDDKLSCSICVEQITSNKTTLVGCPNCKKYIGHFLCVANWLVKNMYCPLCRFKYENIVVNEFGNVSL